jgi:membrane protein DedA with SNARE-associated domain
MSALLVLFLVVLVLNLIPAFAPPTWMVFSFLGFRFPDHVGWTFALVGALAATMGRSVLAKMAHGVVRNRWMSEASRDNVDSLKESLEKRPKLTFGVFLFYAFTPLPSNFVFIAYGLTTMRLMKLAFPFFLGRFVSYGFWTLSAAAVSQRFGFDDGKALGYLSVYFVLTQLALLGMVYLFTRLDWKALVRERRWRLAKRS